MSNSQREISDEIMRLSRRIRRFIGHSEKHITRLDSIRLYLLHNQAISLKDLAGLMDIRPPSLSEWIDKLISDGEVIKERDQDDKRAIRLSLTDKGRAHALEAKEKRQDFSLFEDCLHKTEEQDLLKIIDKLHQHLDMKKSEIHSFKKQGGFSLGGEHEDKCHKRDFYHMDRFERNRMTLKEED